MAGDGGMGRSTFSLFGDAMGKIASLVGSEVRLARVEVSEKIAGAIAAVAAIVGAAVFAVVALVVLTQGVIALLAEHGWRTSTASFLTGFVILLVAGAALLVARSKLSASHLTPMRSVAQAKSTADMVRGRHG